MNDSWLHSSASLSRISIRPLLYALTKAVAVWVRRDEALGAQLFAVRGLSAQWLEASREREEVLCGRLANAEAKRVRRRIWGLWLLVFKL